MCSTVRFLKSWSMKMASIEALSISPIMELTSSSRAALTVLHLCLKREMELPIYLRCMQERQMHRIGL